MARDKISSEEKLLQIIEDPSAAKSAGGKNLFSARRNARQQGRIKRWVKFLGRKENLLKLLKVQVVNKLLIGVCIVATFFLIFDFIYQNNKFKNRFADLEKTAEKRAKVTEEKFAFNIDFEQSLQQAQDRNIFSLYPPKKEQVVSSVVAVDYTQEINNLKMVGIIWSEQNPQVMIEDTRDGRTHLLISGDTLRVFEIKTVHKDHVVLEREGSEWVLR